MPPLGTLHRCVPTSSAGWLRMGTEPKNGKARTSGSLIRGESVRLTAIAVDTPLQPGGCVGGALPFLAIKYAPGVGELVTRPALRGVRGSAPIVEQDDREIAIRENTDRGSCNSVGIMRTQLSGIFRR